MNVGERVRAGIRRRDCAVAAVDPHIKPVLRVGRVAGVTWPALRGWAVSAGVLHDEVAAQIRNVEPGASWKVENGLAADDGVATAIVIGSAYVPTPLAS